MRLYKGKDGTIIPRYSQEEAIKMQLSADQRIPIYRAMQQIGHFDRELGIAVWNMGVLFAEDVEDVSLFRPVPEQGEYHNLISKDTHLPRTRYYQLNEDAGSTAEEKPGQGE